ncbi:MULTISPECIES: ABC transporter ATP-binding protein [Aeromonas]|uniref:ABC transporter ATP-binding protein n=1 Tax=Aeromonas TaxID=642 RepID=UPI00111A2B79|nr:ABC transporter ATP-binding protein [Aeromonas dhakensis]TNI53883.1 ABC transporter ATP-binding protein [Aeromonas dhakensis]
MSKPVLAVTGVNKSFPIYQSPWQALWHALNPKANVRLFHALRDISLTVYPGETLGIVGHNGAGKSTLLQLITGVMQPDSGQISCKGRVAGLLELGSGFNPEFTGRENVFFNGAILGLSRQEMNERLSQILAFAAIGDFIDQPVKTYSSGMMVRLAFSVIINTDPDVLIIDEALAVGDDAFQRKCYARLKQLQAQGVTILLVSHSAGSVIELCDRALLLDRGEVLLEGEPKNVIHNYHKLLHMEGDERDRFRDHLCQTGFGNGYVSASVDIEAPSVTTSGGFLADMTPQSTVWYESNGALITQVRLENAVGEIVNVLESGLRYRYCFNVNFDQEAFEVGFGMLIKTLSGVELGGGTSTRNHEHRIAYVAAGTKLAVEFDFECALRNGTYFLNCGCSALIQGERTFLHRGVDVAMFQVICESADSTGMVDFSPLIKLDNMVHEK